MAGAKNASATSATSASGSDQQATDVTGAAVEVTNELKGQVAGLGSQVRQQANEQFATQKERLVDTLETVSLVLHQTGEHADLQDKEMLAHYVDQASHTIGQWSDSLRNQDLTQLLDETRNLARRQPLLFVSGALALGFVGARFLRTSTPQPEQAQSSTPSTDSTSGDRSLSSGDWSSSSASTQSYADSSMFAAGSTFGVLPDTDAAYGTDMPADVGGYLEDREGSFVEGEDVAVGSVTDADDFMRPERS